MVQARLNQALSKSSLTILICDQVTVAPLESNTVVFNNGTSKGLIAKIPVGGHACPISTAGDKDEWKKAQKKAKKNITSLLINKTIPIRIPRSTFLVCLPCNVASRITSRHH